MADKEYTYDIDKYTIGVDENGEDGIVLTIAIIKNGKINFLGNCYGENARCIDLLIKENAELKSQLRGTTHCFDEEEHNKLKEEITNLSKDVDMWNAKYNDMFDENRMLKKRIEECQLQNFDLREDIMIQKQAIPNKLIKDKTFYDLYDMPTYEDLLNQQKEFINYLEDEKDYFVRGCSNVYEDGLGRTRLVNEDIFDEIDNILQKYRSIIGDDK